MSKAEDTAYAEWKKSFESTLPEDLKESFQTLVNHDAGKEVFRANLRREDFNRRVNELSAERQRLQTWFESEAPKNAQLVAKAAELQDKLANYESTLRELGLEGEGMLPAKAAAASAAKKDEIEAVRKELTDKLQQIDQALPKFLGDLSTVIHRSVKENYNVNPQDVLAYAQENRVDPIKAFEDLTAGERGKREAEAQKNLQEKWKEEGRREALSKLPNPDRIRQSGPSIIDTLTDKDFTSDPRARVAASVKDFLEGDFRAAGNGLF